MRTFLRLFWSINTLKTEKWLQSMALNGYILKEIRGVSSFLFKKDTPQNLNYRILYKNQFICKSLELDNWKLCYSKNNFTILFNNTDYKLDVDRQPIISRLTTLRNSLLIPYFIYFSFAVLPMIFISNIFSNPTTEIHYMPFWWIGPILFLSIHFSIIYIIIKLTKIIKSIKNSCSIPNFDKSNKNQSLKGNTIRKLKLGWLYSPDKIESYLENMESQGYNLKSIFFLGNGVAFVKGSPKNVKYCVDYQTKATSHYYSMYKSEDWTLCYKTSDIIGNYFIWSKEYSDLNNTPNIYTDSESKLKTAQKVLIKFSLLFLPAIFIFSIVLTQMYSFKSPSYSTIIYTVVILEYLFLYSKVLSYYFRVRKSVVNS